jgi:hypothetical protein
MEEEQDQDPRNGWEERLTELEQQWTFNENNLDELLNKFRDETGTLLPGSIDRIFNVTWLPFKAILGEFETSEPDEGDNDNDAFNIAFKKRLFRFQEILYNARNVALSFLHVIGNTNAYPGPRFSENLFWLIPKNFENLKDTPRLILYLLGMFQQRGYMKYNGNVMEQYITQDGYPSRAFNSICDIKTMIYRFCPKDTNMDLWSILTSSGSIINTVTEYLTNCNDSEFPTLNMKRHIWSFKDGIYDAHSDTFYRYDGNHILSEEIVSCNYIDLIFQPAMQIDPDAITAPLFESIGRTQNWTDDMIAWLYIFFGRLFWRVNERDSWQVISFFKGTAGTGKSTIIRVLDSIYRRESIGTISNNIEKQFGLYAIHDKLIFTIPEMKNDFSMDQATFQSMITGESVSLPIKHNPIAKQIVWDVPGILAGNEAPGWRDKAGSISRRIVVFPFLVKVNGDRLDPLLIDKIQAEVPLILRKSSQLYRRAARDLRERDIWTVLPPQFLVEKKNLQFSTNCLFSFLNSEKVIKGDGLYVLEEKFITDLRSYTKMKFSNTQFNFDSDFYHVVFMDEGISVQQTDLPWPIHSNNIQRATYIIGCATI